MVNVNADATVTFSLNGEGGRHQEVFLAGDFNNWNPKVTRMPYLADKGVFAVSLTLPKGRHQYKFVVDDAWCADPENVMALPNDQGTFNSLVEV